MSNHICPACGCVKPMRLAGLLVRPDATFWRGMKVHLTQTHQRILSHMAENGGFISHAALDLLLGGSCYQGRVQIHNLRCALARIDGPAVITDHGKGYRLEVAP